MAFVPHWSSSNSSANTLTHSNVSGDLPTTSTSSSTCPGVTTDTDSTTAAAAVVSVSNVSVSVGTADATQCATDNSLESDSESSSSDAKQLHSSVAAIDASYFSEQERDQMTQLPSKEYLIRYTIYYTIHYTAVVCTILCCTVLTVSLMLACICNHQHALTASATNTASNLVIKSSYVVLYI